MEIAKKFKVSHTTILSRLLEAGVQIRSSGETKKAPLPMDEVIKLYVEGGKSGEYIAKKFGVCSTTIRNRLRQAGISLRKSGRKNLVYKKA